MVPALLHRACAVILRSRAVVSRAVSEEPRSGPVPLPPRFKSDRYASIRSVRSTSLSAPGMAVIEVISYQTNGIYDIPTMKTLTRKCLEVFPGEVTEHSFDWLTGSPAIASRLKRRDIHLFFKNKINYYTIIHFAVDD